MQPTRKCFIILYIYPHLTISQYSNYGHQTKLRDIGREDDLESLQKDALAIAREIADETGTQMAGNLCGTGVYSISDTDSHTSCREMFKVNTILEHDRYVK